MIGEGEHTPLWLSHHWPDDHGHCVSIRGRMACRRCLVLYPLALATAVVFGLWVEWPERIDAWALWVLPLPAVLELVGEQLGLLRSRPGRLVACTVPLAVACGRLYLRYLDDHTDALVLGVTATYTTTCLAVVLIAAWYRGRHRGDDGSARVLDPPEPLGEVARIGEVAGVVPREARDGQERQQAEREADRPAREAEPGHGQP